MGFDDYTKKSLKEFIDQNILTSSPSFEPIIVGISIPPLSQRFKIANQLVITVTNHDGWTKHNFQKDHGIELHAWEFHDKEDLQEAVQFLADEYHIEFGESFYKDLHSNGKFYLMLGTYPINFIQ